MIAKRLLACVFIFALTACASAPLSPEYRSISLTPNPYPTDWPPLLESTSCEYLAGTYSVGGVPSRTNVLYTGTAFSPRFNGQTVRENPWAIALALYLFSFDPAGRDFNKFRITFSSERVGAAEFLLISDSDSKPISLLSYSLKSPPTQRCESGQLILSWVPASTSGDGVKVFYEIRETTLMKAANGDLIVRAHERFSLSSLMTTYRKVEHIAWMRFAKR